MAVSIWLFIVLLATAGGCGGMILAADPVTSGGAFEAGELRSTQEAPLSQVDSACEQAIERLGYEDVEIERETDRIRYRARSVGGEPVDIRLVANDSEHTDVRIRIGILGDETTSRLVLEEIHQSL